MSSFDKLTNQLGDRFEPKSNQSHQSNQAITTAPSPDQPVDQDISNAQNAQNASIVISHLSVRYRSVEALRDLNLVIEPGQLTGMIGPNGAGKSTMLKAMLGLIPAWGIARYRDRPLVEQLEQVAYVPQRSQIDWTYPTTVWDVVMMGRVRKTGWFKRFSNVSRRVAKEALDRVQMLDFADRRIGQLSGGQQQRVFLARSLAQEAEIFCFDEPFVGVDQKTEDIIFQIFHELAAAGKIVLVVNHDLGESITNFDRLILLNRELVASGDRDLVLQPEHMQRAYGGKVAFFAA
ncbi:Phosphonate-transporting ATPase [Thalassoporum mexicanum PCC 7367]|uniref:metal ABC transporter ATP-binding protein n=1 Tax=Thalassoporum mexicanum TaxID=3457544 RepID=UPI00029FDC60|nr:metal ABC transporter ATP-binding protein [Pseudanabaena sp. PCC 7367]AFY68957.1 Phosphonate-transporting ATPase [Pseudanabaena sp. PCC 7367]